MIAYLIGKNPKKYQPTKDDVPAFAEALMSRMMRKVAQKAALYYESDERLLVDQAQFTLQLDQLSKHEPLDTQMFKTMRRRVRTSLAIAAASFFALVLFSGAVIMQAITASAASPTPVLVPIITISLLALVLSAVTVVVAQRLVKIIMHHDRERKNNPGKRRFIVTLWVGLLIGIEITLTGLAWTQSGILVGTAAFEFVRPGLTLIAALLPVIAGVAYWDATRYLERYRTEHDRRDVTDHLNRIQTVFQQRRTYSDNFYRSLCLSYWEKLHDFKSEKATTGASEKTSDKPHFSDSFESFMLEAEKRYLAVQNQMLQSELAAPGQGTMPTLTFNPPTKPHTTQGDGSAQAHGLDPVLLTNTAN